MEIWQIIVLMVFAFLQQILTISYLHNGFSRPVMAGFITGLVMGDIATGLLIGGTLELMMLGVATFGGASVPDYISATIISTAIAVSAGIAPEQSVALAIPVAILLVQCDIIGRMGNTFFLQKAKKYAAVGDIDGIKKMNYLGNLGWGLSRAIPVGIGLAIGPEFVAAIVENLPEPIMNGLAVSAGILPVIGIAILLRYLPFGSLFLYFLLGFILSAAFGLNLLMVTAIGVIIIGIMYKNEKENSQKVVVTADFGGEIDD